MTDDGDKCVMGRLEAGFADIKDTLGRLQKQLDAQDETLAAMKTDYDRIRGAGAVALFAFGLVGVYFGDTIKLWLKHIAG